MPELNHADKWAASPEVGSVLKGADVTAIVAESPERALVSGDLAAFARVSDAVMLRLARDRALVLGSTGLGAGWHDEGFALSDLSAGLALVQLTGPGLADLVAKATTADLSDIGPSKAITFAGIAVVLGGTGDALDLHVERGLLAYLWSWTAAALREPSA